MSADQYIEMRPIQCVADCGAYLGWSDAEVEILCNYCMNHPGEVAVRMGLEWDEE